MQYLLSVIALTVLLSVDQAHASLMRYNFEYEFESAQVLSGMLVGDLLADGDTIEVISVSTVSYTGDFDLVFDDTIFIPDPIVSISGELMSMAGGIPISLGAWQFVHSTGPDAESLAAIAVPIVVRLEDELFSPERWRLTAKVPLPSTAALLLLGLAIHFFSAARSRRIGALHGVGSPSGPLVLQQLTNSAVVK